jgi:hypothetical protein
VQVTSLYTNGNYLPFHTPSVSLEDGAGEWAGVLRLHHGGDFSHLKTSTKMLVELVAISFGRARNSEKQEHGLEEWKLEERPKDSQWYEFYNVLWISWRCGIAYRRGLGHVRKDIWARQRSRNIDLILG